MKIAELEQHEKIAFGCLVRMMIRSDGHFSAEEETLLEKIGTEELGHPENLWHIISLSAAEFPEEKDGRGTVSEVTRPEARELILRVLERVAGADEVEASEAELIDWVRQTWR